MSDKPKTDLTVEARLEAAEFAASLGLYAYAHNFYGTGWTNENLFAKLSERAQQQGYVMPQGEAQIALQSLIEKAWLNRPR